MTLQPAAWKALMDKVVEEAGGEVANFSPGNVLPPGTGTEGDDPNGLRYVDFGPLAFVLLEALDAAVNTGADRAALLGEIAGGGLVADVEAVLAGEVKCPPYDLLQSFATQLSIDLETILDAAKRGGCTGSSGYAGAPSDGTAPGE
jgi:hypothetical protein